MTNQPPPNRFTGKPATMTLPAGTVLSRVHRARYGATAFNPIPANVRFGGGRFDATRRCLYGYMYAALEDSTAVAETLLRDIPSDDYGRRFLAKKYWTGRRVSRLRTTADVELVALRTAEELGAIGQDPWLADCDPRDYPQTRAWAHWLREIAPDAAGLAWDSKRDPTHTVFVLFEDRCPTGALAPEPGPFADGLSFDDPAGFSWLRATLGRYRVSVRGAGL